MTTMARTTRTDIESRALREIIEHLNKYISEFGPDGTSERDAFQGGMTFCLDLAEGLLGGDDAQVQKTLRLYDMPDHPADAGFKKTHGRPH
jgi:hypothetical protein